ncbi:hypothetical protein CDD80_486 [Ophiocordyceps camponoti-rufipedis]|uniref:Uncharacterized protein n=1 Tax=Ophiocordyceps camponoti-rufipedis TaxID=2004952 RepID=A0A2C5ZDQ7_9HYPO|nr:hypothetical protein CDD80_486 [Ophiocordyceps camponoti-rufipedis]
MPADLVALDAPRTAPSHGRSDINQPCFIWPPPGKENGRLASSLPCPSSTDASLFSLRRFTPQTRHAYMSSPTSPPLVHLQYARQPVPCLDARRLETPASAIGAPPTPLEP